MRDMIMPARVRTAIRVARARTSRFERRAKMRSRAAKTSPAAQRFDASRKRVPAKDDARTRYCRPRVDYARRAKQDATARYGVKKTPRVVPNPPYTM